VVNYDIPYDTEAYVHRIGRTGRAGRKGEAILFVSPREKRLLRAIEVATRQPIAPMQIPSHADVADRRIARFKQTISDTVEAEELGFYEDLIGSYQREHNIGLGEIAAALAFLLQRAKPLVPEEAQVPSPRQAVARSTGAGQRGRSQQEAGMVHYRIEVGRTHGVQPKHIVGAIANEAGLESQYIGQITLFDAYSLVDLPEGMPKEIFRHLRTVWVCGRQLRISLADGPPPREAPTKPQRPKAAAKTKRKTARA
jgi:ATP-dependent RNA helicase DeaD